MNRVLCKVYAAFSPACANSLQAVARAARSAISPDAAAECFFLEGDLLRISWEGIYFPLEDVLQALTSTLPPEARGKLDCLDLEAWTLTRHCIERRDGKNCFSTSRRSLNHVLDYSGH